MGHARPGGIHVTHERVPGTLRCAAYATGTRDGPAAPSDRTRTARPPGTRLLCGSRRRAARATETLEQTRRRSARVDAPGSIIRRAAACLRAGLLHTRGGIHPLGGVPSAHEQGAGHRSCGVLPFGIDRCLCVRKSSGRANLLGPKRITRGDSAQADRKSTRLNSSHVAISYAVFCLKKKTNTSTGTAVR